MLTALIALALQAAAPVPAPQDPVSRAGQAWGACVKTRADAGLRSAQTAEALADSAIAACVAELEAIRVAIAAGSNAEVAALNIERVRTGTRALFVAYIQRERGQGATPPPGR